MIYKQKAHTREKFWSNMKILIEVEQFETKKKCEADSQKTNKKVFIWPHEPKTPRSREKEISSKLTFEGWCKMSGEKRSWWSFSCSEEEKKWLQLAFKFSLVEQTSFIFEIYFDKLLTSQEKFDPQLKIQHFRNSSFWLA